MKTHAKCALVLAAISFTLTLADAGGTQGRQGPRYASPKAKNVIERMVQAHGGLRKWQEARTLSYDNIFFNPYAKDMQWPSPWWVSHEVVDLQKRRAYHDWQLDQAKLAFDGDKVWTVGWKSGNMPKMQAMSFFYFATLPFLTQDANVSLDEPGTGKIPGSDKQYVTVLMKFTEKPTAGKTIKDSYKLYIDPDTHLLQAYEYHIGFGAMLDAMSLPPGQETFGPMLRIHDRFTTVDGLILPAEMHTLPPDGSTTYGNHVLFNYSLSEKFDESRMKMPAGAKVDDSSDLRASK